MHTSNSLHGWRKLGVVAGSLAVLATGGAAVATQAFAEPGHDGAHQPAAPKAKAKGDKRTSGDMSRTQVQQSNEATGLATTGRAHAAALYGAVTELVPGQGSDIRGQGTRFVGEDGPGSGWLAAGGEFTFTPDDGSGAGGVEVGVMDKSMFPGYMAECQDYMQSCKLSDLPDGSQLLSYAEDLGGGAKRLVVDHYVGDIRVTVASINAPYTSGKTLSVSRPDPVLSIDQLTEIATKPWWSLDATIDSPYADALPSYQELNPQGG